ncbi:hypothetical protein Tco_0159403, partial [Tanacetum coccineum]
MSIQLADRLVNFNIGKSMRSKYSRITICTAPITLQNLSENNGWTQLTMTENESKRKKNKTRKKSGRFHFTPSKNQSNHWNEKLKKIGYPSMTEPPKLELKELPEHLEYAFLQGDDQLPIIISSALYFLEKTKLLE